MPKELHNNHNSFSVGQHVFAIYHNTVVSGTIELFTRDNKTDADYAQLKFNAPLYGTAGVKIENLFTTESDALSAYDTRFRRQVETYEAQMTSLEDMVRFAIQHINHDDEEAYTAYMNRAKAFGIVD